MVYQGETPLKRVASLDCLEVRDASWRHHRYEAVLEECGAAEGEVTMLKRSMILLAVVTLLMVVTVPAQAGAPVSDPFGFDFEFQWVDEQNDNLTTLCGFDVFSSGHMSQVEKWFFDREGALSRVEVHAKGNIDTYAPDLGTSLKSRFAVQISEKKVKGTTNVWTQTFKGNGWNIHAPGSGLGTIVHDKGLVTFVWKGPFWWMNLPAIEWAGHHDVLVDGINSDLAMCEALAP